MKRKGEKGEKRDVNPNLAQAIKKVNETVRGFGFTQEEIGQAKKDLSHYMPKEVFFDKFRDDKASGIQGSALLYAIYAPQIVSDYFKEERRMGESGSQNPKSRRIQFEQFAGDIEDYIQNVFTGYHDDQERLKGGVWSVAVPSSTEKFNSYAYDPTMNDSRKSLCPHCKVSFWPVSAGNGNPKYKMTGGKPLREWRETPDQAPEHIRFNPSTGEEVEAGGYSYCGGRFKIYDVTAPDGTINIEAAEKLSGMNWDQLRQQDRVRTTAKEGSLKHYLVDEYLPEVEKILGGKVSYMKFSDEWVFEDSGVLYRQCRHPISLRSPASVIHDRIYQYTFKVTEKKSSGRTKTIMVYYCPKCPGDFRDKEGITTIEGPGRVVEVKCDDCGAFFNIDELPSDHIDSMSWTDPIASLNVPTMGEEGVASELIDTVGRRDIGPIEVEMAEIFEIFDKEIEQIARTLNVQGAQYAKEILMDWTINSLSYRELTEKYLVGIYRLHYTECADCGYTEDEKPSPNPGQNARYDQGLPVVLLQCPNRKTHPNHKVNLPQIATPQSGVVEIEPDELDPQQQLAVSRDEAVTQKKTDAEIAASIQDDNERRRFLGTNLIYHGDSRGTGRPGISYQVLDIEHGITQELSDSDPRSYKGENGNISQYTIQPAKRLIEAIVGALAQNPRIRERYQDALDVLDDWVKGMGESSTRFAKVKSFCRTKI